MKKIKCSLIVLGFLALSCNKENEPVEIANAEGLNSLAEAKVEKEIKNGRFVFTSKESLDKTIEQLQNQEVELVEEEFEKLYDKGFRSHKAVVNPTNEKLLAKFSKEIIQKRKLQKSSSTALGREDAENEEELIPDPLLASLVNENKEIVVNDSLYRITEEGVFIVHVKDSIYLFDYLKELQSGTVNKLSGDVHANRSANGGYSRITSRVSRYIRPLRIYDDWRERTQYNLSSSPSTSSVLSDEDKLQNLISNLEECDDKEPFFQGLLGNVFVCIDKFDRKHRVKTEFWDQNWGFYKSAGVLVKTQRKRFGIWWRSNANEIHLGINKILLRYNVPAPEVLKYKQPSNVHSDLINSQEPIFMYNNYYYTKNLSFNNAVLGATFNNTWTQTQLKVQKNRIPFFKFDDADILNIYIPLQKVSGLLDDINVNLTLGNTILTDSNIKNLYKSGFNFLKSAGSSKKAFVVTYQKNEREVEVLYFAKRYSKKNTNMVKDRIFEDKDFLVSYSNSLDGKGGKFGVDFSPVTNIGHRRYTHYEIDFYGLARRGNRWRGSRLVKNN